MSNRLNQEREAKLQPKRIQYAINQIESLGYEVYEINETMIAFKFKGSVIKLFPYSGWHTGKTIKDGRGIHKLLKQIK